MCLSVYLFEDIRRHTPWDLWGSTSAGLMSAVFVCWGNLIMNPERRARGTRNGAGAFLEDLYCFNYSKFKCTLLKSIPQCLFNLLFQIKWMDSHNC